MLTRIVLILLLPIILFGCAHNAPQAHKTPSSNPTAHQASVAQSDHTAELLVFYESFSDANAESQKNMLAELNKPTSDSMQNLLRQIKLAMVYGLPSSRMRDTAKAQSLLLDTIQSNELKMPDIALVNLLYEWITDTNKLTKQKIDKSQQQRTDTLQQKNEQLQQKLQALEQKLEALKKIEKTMGEREAAPTKP